MDLGRENGFLAEAVFNTGNRVALGGQRQRWNGIVFSAGPPGAAVNPNDERERLFNPKNYIGESVEIVERAIGKE